MKRAANEPLTTADGDRGSSLFDLHTEGFERPLRMVACRKRFEDTRHTRGMESRKEHGALDLRAGDVGLEIDRGEPVRPQDRQRRTSILR